MIVKWNVEMSNEHRCLITESQKEIDSQLLYYMYGKIFCCWSIMHIIKIVRKSQVYFRWLYLDMPGFGSIQIKTQHKVEINKEKFLLKCHSEERLVYAQACLKFNENFPERIFVDASTIQMSRSSSRMWFKVSPRKLDWEI